MSAASTRPAETADLRDRPLGEVVRDLTRDLSLLARQELELAKSELAQKSRKAVPGLAMLAGGAAAALMAAGAITACGVLVLALFLPEWLSALLVAAVLAGLAYALATRGKKQIERLGTPVPEQTIETVKEDVAWVKTRATSARR
jgi:Flp pilus assembly protein TadB